MIVIVGSPIGRLVDGRVEAGGLAARVAVAAGHTGGVVQLVGRIGDDADADRLLLALASAGVGHVAVLRDPARATPIDDAETDTLDDALDDAEVAIEADAEPDDPRSRAPSIDSIPLDAADVELGLRYLTDFRVVVLTPPATSDVVAVAAEAARWASARLVLVVGAPRDDANTAVAEPLPSLPSDAVVLQAPESDPDGAFAVVVGRLAAALDAGADPATAFRDVVNEAGWAAAAIDG
jgi:sugar/nucleoside kinase (ribokinase family)